MTARTLTLAHGYTLGDAGRAAIYATVTVVGLVLTACTQQQSGEPRPEPSSPNATSSPTTQTADAPTIADLDLCTLLTPEDLPVDPGPDGHSEQGEVWDGDRCENSIQLANPFDVMVAGVSKWEITLDDFLPPNDDGQYLELAGRPAWVGHSTAGERGCNATFDAADGRLAVTVTDEIQLDADPCDTVTELAEIVISRAPPPNEQ